MFDVATIGSVTRDNFLESDYEIINWPKAPSRKALVLPFGEKLEVKKNYSTIGGNSANASVTFSRFGFKTACFGKVGDDFAGREIQERLRGEKVRLLLAVSRKAETAYSALLLKDGERTILSHHGASDTLVLSDIKWDALKSSWWYLSLAGESYKLFRPLLVFAKKNNIRVAFNPSGYHIKHNRKEILASLNFLSFLVLNAGEASELVGISFQNPAAVFKKLDKLTPGIVAVTDGPKGVMVSDGKYLYKAGIFKERLIADRTGAGDAFGSGFVAGLMEKSKIKDQNVKAQIKNKNLFSSAPLCGASEEFRSIPRSLLRGASFFSTEDIKYAIRLASANATSVVECVGATEGILTRKQFQSSRWKEMSLTAVRF